VLLPPFFPKLLEEFDQEERLVLDHGLVLVPADALEAEVLIVDLLDAPAVVEVPAVEQQSLCRQFLAEGVVADVAEACRTDAKL
jgi:hypothetical protein